MSPDFTRDVHCLLGLPFDAVDLSAAESRIRRAITQRTPCFLSTPNLNFAMACRGDAEFRDSILNSDLVIADGMPLVWLSRLLGIPIRDRVAGSDLFETLREDRSRPLSVFFFGGPDGVAAAACERLNGENRGLRCVGHIAPGFVSVEAMSTDAIVQQINVSGADFLVVALGARKGQAWIELNRRQLTVPVISHLGAVVNFVAGTVRRAPTWMQRCGLEWVWRILEEPGLWRRYVLDGLSLAGVLAVRVLPHAVAIRLWRPAAADISRAAISVIAGPRSTVIRLSGAWIASNLGPLREAFRAAVTTETDIELDMGEVTYVDTALIGLLLLLRGYQRTRGRRLTVTAARDTVRSLLLWSGSDFLLDSAVAPLQASAGPRPAPPDKPA